jgi:hypothetical protein
VALDSRPRPVRRPARRRVPLLTALALLVMAAGLWFAGPAAAASVPAPRLQVAEARVAAAVGEPATEVPDEAPEEAPEPVADVAGEPVVGRVAAAPAVVVLSVAGPRAPPQR